MSDKINGRLFCLVSVNSSHYTQDNLEAIENTCTATGLEVDFILIDEPEVYNIMALESMGVEDARLCAHSRSNEYRNKMVHWGYRPKKWLDAVSENLYRKYREWLSGSINESRKVKSEVLNQTYSNLYPKFRKLGINKNDDRVLIATEYLIDEIAMKLCLYDNRIYDGEVMWCEEMRYVLKCYEDASRGAWLGADYRVIMNYSDGSPVRMTYSNRLGLDDIYFYTEKLIPNLWFRMRGDGKGASTRGAMEHVHSLIERASCLRDAMIIMLNSDTMIDKDKARLVRAIDYILDEYDYLPESVVGELGYLDDVALVASEICEILDAYDNCLPKTQSSHIHSLLTDSIALLGEGAFKKFMDEYRT